MILAEAIETVKCFKYFQTLWVLIEGKWVECSLHTFLFSVRFLWRISLMSIDSWKESIINIMFREKCTFYWFFWVPRRDSLWHCCENIHDLEVRTAECFKMRAPVEFTQVLLNVFVSAWLIDRNKLPSIYITDYYNFPTVRLNVSRLHSFFLAYHHHHNIIRSNWSQIITNLLHKSSPLTHFCVYRSPTWL